LKEKVVMNQPFSFGIATYGELFTDRESETKRLIKNFENGVNTLIISPRRWGKTSLVHNVARTMNATQHKIIVVNIDVFLCRNESDFFKLFSTEIIKQTYTKWDEWADRTKRFLARLSPRMSFGTDPVNDFSISLDFSERIESEKDVLSLPEKIAKDKGVRVVVCIDEFQQIAEFQDSISFQKKLRSCWQLQKNVTYCLYGSKMHILSTLFSKQSMPFYKFGDVMFLQKIPTSEWVGFIRLRFEKTGKKISEEIAENICSIVQNHSSYVQQLSYIVWVKTEKKVTDEILSESLQELIEQNAVLYYSIVDGLTRYQINFLRALVSGITHEYTSSGVINKYDLGSSANVVRIWKSLEKKEIIDISGKRIIINDPIFSIWLKRELNF